MKNNILKKSKRKKQIVYLSNILLFFPSYGLNNTRKIKKTKKRKHLGGNNTPIDVTECLSQGFCSGDFPSTIPNNLQDYAVTDFSDTDSTNTAGDLHKTAELTSNLAIGDNNYDAATPPNGAEFLPKN
tara:strand:- start:393 stop:776 length:384 start_codon:yes stop_codon:yes gene_type:complete